MSGDDWAIVVALAIIFSWVWIPLLMGLVIIILQGIVSIIRALKGLPEEEVES